jgi:Zn-dependent oligopeptidase
MRAELVLPGALGVRLELAGEIEVVDDGVLAARADEDHVAHARRDRLRDDVLDRGGVHDRQELLRDGLRRREEPRPEPRGGDHGLADLLRRHGPAI